MPKGLVRNSLCHKIHLAVLQNFSVISNNEIWSFCSLAFDNSLEELVETENLYYNRAEIDINGEICIHRLLFGVRFWPHFCPINNSSNWWLINIKLVNGNEVTIKLYISSTWSIFTTRTLLDCLKNISTPQEVYLT